MVTNLFKMILSAPNFRIFISFIILFLPSPIFAQTPENTSPFHFDGNLELTASYQERPSVSKRLGKNFTERFLLSATLSDGQHFTMPMQMMLTSEPTSYPAPPADVEEYLMDPANLISIRPKYKWFEVSLGSQIPQKSSLALGSRPFFGTGITLNPGKFIFSYAGGISQRASTQFADPTQVIPRAAYARKTRRLSFGYGKLNFSHLHFNLTKSLDDTTLVDKPKVEICDSIEKTDNTIHEDCRSIELLPKHELVLSIDYRLNINHRYYIKGEITGTAYSADSHASKVGLKWLRPIFVTNVATMRGFANELTFGKKGKFWDMSLQYDRINGGFKTMNQPYVSAATDHVKVNNNFNAFQNKLVLNNTFGIQFRNLSNKNQRNSNIFSTINLTASVTNSLSLNATFSNYYSRAKHIIDIDTNSISTDNMVNLGSFTFSPSYILYNSKHFHYFSTIFSLDITGADYINLTINTNTEETTSRTNSNTTSQSKGLTVLYRLKKLKKPISIELMANSFYFISFGLNEQAERKLYTTRVSVTYKHPSKQSAITGRIGANYVEHNRQSNVIAIRKIIGTLVIHQNLSEKLKAKVYSSIRVQNRHNPQFPQRIAVAYTF